MVFIGCWVVFFLFSVILNFPKMISASLFDPSQPGNFPYRDEIMDMNVCLVFIVLLFIGCILAFKVTKSSY